jgi:predicted NAD/FAD-binding protein
MFSLQAIAAAKKIEDFNGLNRSWFAGAYLGNGFHEDGVVSGRKVADAINRISSGVVYKVESDPEPAHA